MLTGGASHIRGEYMSDENELFQALSDAVVAMDQEKSIELAQNLIEERFSANLLPVPSSSPL